jgi:hypothetical protein
MPASALAMKLPRPFASSRRSLFFTVLAGWVLILIAQPCNREPFYLEIGAMVFTFTLAAWVNHLARAPVTSAKDVAIVAGWSLYDVFALASLALVVSSPFAFFLPTHCYTDRARASEVLLAGSLHRDDVASNARKLGSVVGSGRGLTFKPHMRAVAGLVTDDGAIVSIGADPPVVFLLTPAFVGESIVWSCAGFPQKLAPASCTKLKRE